ncbi:hypothetical protein BRARA_D00386 [Brassica rapa]|uniref:Aspartate/glutamate/uridylate kinase domain-containing protein n=1 Tax=Brassica campestris TaxID=3711 RepID=A0A397ZP73_BRACM|nr:hypothetical protein BRARA_D00386 [Brassica rapa]
MAETDRSRAFTKNVKRIVVKVGTAVVTGKDGRLALGRLGAICEQLAELNSDGFEVILVSSGAVGLGRQRLRYRQLVNSSFADLQKPQNELDGKACAAVGQSSLMAYYETMFDQLDVTVAQMLVTDKDFRDKDFRKQLSETVKAMMKMRVIPVFNENDAISTRKAPYKDSTGIFWDNDSLAALLSLELKADLLVLLSDVEGLYTGPPTDPNSTLIHTYIKEKHQEEITFGEKSKLGRGGMTAKVKAAVSAAYGGIPVIITSGFAADNIAKVLNGLRVGTLFHQDAHLWAPVVDTTSRDMAVAARESSRKLQALSSEERKNFLLDIANALEANEKIIKAENDLDVAVAQQAGYEESLVARLVMKPGKLDDVIDLVIPRGSNKLVSQIKNSTKIPVLGHADGICHVYVDKSCNLDMAKRVVSDAKLDYPAACNAMETLLVHKDLENNGVLNELIFALQANGVTLYGGPRASGKLNIPETQSFHHEYSAKACTVEIVEDVHGAIDHIHNHGSAHTDCIVTEDSEVADIFLRQVDSAAVFHNASTRFCDGFRFGLGAEVGISTSRIHARGPVGVEGLLTTRWIMRGEGQVVDGDKGVAYTHKDLPVLKRT